MNKLVSIKNKINFWIKSFIETLTPGKFVLLLLWVFGIGGLLVYLHHIYGFEGMLDIKRIAEDMKTNLISTGNWAPLIFIIAYVFRTFTLIPSTTFNLAAGFLFGPIWGILIDFIGVNLSAWMAYAVSRYFGRAWIIKIEEGKVKEFDNLLHKFGWKAVAIFHLLYLPFDVTNYTLGMSSVNWKQYAIGTAIGVLPSTIFFVYIGNLDMSPWLIATVAIIMVAGLIIFNGKWAKKLIDKHK